MRVHYLAEKLWIDMKPLEIVKFSGLCLSVLEERGFEVEQVAPSLAIEEEACAMGKGFVTPTLSSHVSDFTHSSSFWLTMRQSGSLVAVMGMRYDELGDEPLESYLRRAYKRQYKADVSDHAPELLDLLGDKLVYMGDLFFAPSIRGSQSRLMCYVHLAHSLCFMKWQHATNIYAFHRREDVLRGKTDQYGFGDRIPGAQVWRNGPDYRSSHEYLAILSKKSYVHKARFYLKNPSLMTDDA